MNYNGTRGESFGKLKIKGNEKLTNEQKNALNFGRRISEEYYVDQISVVYYANMNYWPSEFCNETDNMMSGNRKQLSKNNGVTNVLCLDLDLGFI